MVMMNRLLVLGLWIGFAASSAQAGTIYGLTSLNQLVSFDSATPGSVTNLGTISQAGIVDIDFSPVNGQLYGATSNGTLYFINLSTAAATLAVSPTSPLSNITDSDFNPAADRLRLFGDVDQSYRITPDVSGTNPATATPGAVSVDGAFTGAATPVDLVGAAYTNNFDGTATTTLYSIDTAVDRLIVHSVAPQFVTVAAVGSLGVTVGSAVGFDIGADGVAYLSDGANLYTVNLGTGAATTAGTVGDLNLTSIAVPVPEPGTAVLLGLGLLSMSVIRRNKR